jgi:integrase
MPNGETSIRIRVGQRTRQLRLTHNPEGGPGEWELSKPQLEAAQREYAKPRAERVTSKALTDAINRLEAEVKSGRFAASGTTTVQQLVEGYFEHRLSKGKVRVTTAARYRQIMRLHVYPPVGGLKIAKLTRPLYQKLIDDLDDSGLAAATVRQAHAVLRASLRFGVHNGLLSVNPSDGVVVAQSSRKALEIPEPDEIRKLLAAVEGTDFHPVLLLLATSGLRRSELCGLRWSRVDFERKTVRVIEGLHDVGTADVTNVRAIEPVGEGLALMRTKSGRERLVSVPETTLESLRQRRREQSERRLLLGPAWHDAADGGFVFDRGDGRPLHPNVVSRRFRRLTARLGVACRLHDLRHAYASTLISAGLNPLVISKQLGHATTAFTLDVYGHLFPGDGDRAADAIERALAPR